MDGAADWADVVGQFPLYNVRNNTPVFNKRKGVFAANLLRQQRNLERVILVEGYMDVIGMNLGGFPNSVATLGTALQSEEYREMWKQMMPEVNLDEMHKVVQSMTIRDIMMQLALYNVLLALPVSLFAALPVRAPQPQKGEKDKS